MMNVSEAIQTIRYRISNKDIVGMESITFAEKSKMDTVASSVVADVSSIIVEGN